jgi:hypothetical protein
MTMPIIVPWVVSAVQYMHHILGVSDTNASLAMVELSEPGCV